MIYKQKLKFLGALGIYHFSHESGTTREAICKGALAYLDLEFTHYASLYENIAPEAYMNYILARFVEFLGHDDLLAFKKEIYLTNKKIRIREQVARRQLPSTHIGGMNDEQFGMYLKLTTGETSQYYLEI